MGPKLKFKKFVDTSAHMHLCNWSKAFIHDLGYRPLSSNKENLYYCIHNLDQCFSVWEVGTPKSVHNDLDSDFP